MRSLYKKSVVFGWSVKHIGLCIIIFKYNIQPNKDMSKLNIPLGMIDVLYGRAPKPKLYSESSTQSSWYQLLLKLEEFGKNPRKAEFRVQESKLPVVCSE